MKNGSTIANCPACGQQMHPTDWKDRLREELAAALTRVAELEAGKDEAYRQRNVLVAAIARLYPSGIRRTNIEGWSEDWHGCVYIDLPSGQISYHYHDSQSALFSALPTYTKDWDGHDKEAVENRLAGLEAAALSAQAQQPVDVEAITWAISLLSIHPGVKVNENSQMWLRRLRVLAGATEDDLMVGGVDGFLENYCDGVVDSSGEKILRGIGSGADRASPPPAPQQGPTEEEVRVANAVIAETSYSNKTLGAEALARAVLRWNGGK